MDYGITNRIPVKHWRDRWVQNVVQSGHEHVCYPQGHRVPTRLALDQRRCNLIQLRQPRWFPAALAPRDTVRWAVVEVLPLNQILWVFHEEGSMHIQCVGQDRPAYTMLPRGAWYSVQRC